MEHIQTTLGEIQEGLLADAKAFRDANIREVATYEELKNAVVEGFWARGPWAGRALMPGTQHAVECSRDMHALSFSEGSTKCPTTMFVQRAPIS